MKNDGVSMEKTDLVLSPLNKTWIFDFDGTLVEHNGYKTGEDHFLPGAKEFLLQIPNEDYILILTAREKEAASQTEEFLSRHGIRYDNILYEMPMGERLLFNDSKPSGLKMSYAVERLRNQGLENVRVEIDESL